jgi:hypothetical protein
MVATKQKNIDQNATLTPEMQGIAERVAGQDTDWFSIGEESMNDFSMTINPFDLSPNYPEAAQLQADQKYAFRWCERVVKRVDELTRSVNPPLRWAIVNNNALPEMKRHIDPMLGCVCNLDQILLFKPWAHAVIVKKARNEMAEAKAKAPEQSVQGEKIEVTSGAAQKITSGDVVQYEDTRGDDLGDLVIDE